jgi:hypothetical protein
VVFYLQIATRALPSPPFRHEPVRTFGQRLGGEAAWRRSYDCAEMDELDAEFEASLASQDLVRLDEQNFDLAFGLADLASETIGTEVLPEIPIVKSLVGVWKATRSISNLLVLKKVVRFFTQLQNIEVEGGGFVCRPLSATTGQQPHVASRRRRGCCRERSDPSR